MQVLGERRVPDVLREPLVVLRPSVHNLVVRERVVTAALAAARLDRRQRGLV